MPAEKDSETTENEINNIKFEYLKVNDDKPNSKHACNMCKNSGALLILDFPKKFLQSTIAEEDQLLACCGSSWYAAMMLIPSMLNQRLVVRKLGVTIQEHCNQSDDWDREGARNLDITWKEFAGGR